MQGQSSLRTAIMKSFLCCWSSHRDFISASKDDEVDVLTVKKVTHCEQLAEKVRESHIGSQANYLKSARINTTNVSFTCKSINTSHLMKVNTSTNLMKGIHCMKIYCTQIWCSLLTHVTIIMSWSVWKGRHFRNVSDKAICLVKLGFISSCCKQVKCIYEPFWQI